MTGLFKSARQAIQSEAADWVLRLDEDVLDASARNELLDWLTQSPQHIDEFLLATAMWRELDNVDAEQHIDVKQLVAEAQSNVVSLGDNVNTLHESIAPRTKSKALWWATGIAATVLVAIGAGLLLFFQDPLRHYETGVGQQTLFTLADDSIVHLNTQSKLTVHMRNDTRELELIQGEAMFEVSRDPERPFRVRSGTVVVEAIGTQFNVYRRGDGTHVTVVEGSVTVESMPPSFVNIEAAHEITLSAGEEAHADQSGDVARIDTPDLEKHTAWREQRLVFRQDRLTAVAEEFNRYNRVQIIVDAPPSTTRQITATFDAHDPESFVSFLERDPRLQVIRSDNVIRITLADGS